MKVKLWISYQELVYLKLNNLLKIKMLCNYILCELNYKTKDKDKIKNLQRILSILKPWFGVTGEKKYQPLGLEAFKEQKSLYKLSRF